MLLPVDIRSGEQVRSLLWYLSIARVMGKNKRKRSSGEQVDRAPVATAITPPEPRSVPGISPADLQATARTLSALLRAPALLRAKECKSIRTQLYSLLRALSLSANTKLYTAQQLSHLVNEALEAGKWAEALVALDALHALDRHPKLGSVQRWIARIGSIWGSDMGCALASAIIRSSSAALAVSPDVLQHSASIIDGVTLLIAWDGWDTERGAVDLVLQPQEQQLIAGMSLAVAANEEGPTDGTHLKVWRDTANTLLLEPALSPPMVRSFVSALGYSKCLRRVQSVQPFFSLRSGNLPEHAALSGCARHLPL